MKKILYLCLLTVVSFQLLTSCQLLTNKQKIITAKDKGKKIYLEKGDFFLVELDSSPEAGYMWDILPYNERVISFINSEFKENKTKEEGLVGKRVVKFKAAAKGKAELNFIYYKVWEKNKAPVNRIDIRIVVK